MNSLEKAIMGVIVISVIQGPLSGMTAKIKWRLRESNLFIKSPYARYLIELMVSCIMIWIIVRISDYNQDVQFIAVGIDGNLSIIIGVLTMYGIFISAVQFMISYSFSNKDSMCWGKSKIKRIIFDSIEYKILNSIYFRLMLMYICIYSMIDIDKLDATIFKHLYEQRLFLDSLFDTCFVIIILEYVVFFLKILSWNRMLFHLTEKKEPFREMIKDDILNDELYHFKWHIENDSRSFFKELFSESGKLEGTEGAERIDETIRYIYSNIKIGNDTTWTILKAYFIKKIGFYHTNQGLNKNRLLHRLKTANDEFWKEYEVSTVQLSINQLLYIYKLQENLLLQTIKNISDGEKKTFVDLLKSVYSKNSNLKAATTFFSVPKCILDKIENVSHAEKVARTLRALNIWNEKMLRFNNDSAEYFEKLKESIAWNYSESIVGILKKIIKFKKKASMEQLGNILNIYNFSRDLEYQKSVEIYSLRNRAEERLKEGLLKMLLNRDNSIEERYYIKEISEILEVKIVVAFILYRVLYTGKDRNFWRYEIEFFRELMESREYELEKTWRISEEYAVSVISQSKWSFIGHNIEEPLIKWIFRNMQGNINESHLEAIDKESYLSLTQFISLRYILCSRKDTYYFEKVIGKISDTQKTELIVGIASIKKIRKCHCLYELLCSVIWELIGMGDDKNKVVRFVENADFNSLVLTEEFVSIELLVEYMENEKRSCKSDILKSLLVRLTFTNDIMFLERQSENLQNILRAAFSREIISEGRNVDTYIQRICDDLNKMGLETSEGEKEYMLKILDTFITYK